MWSSSAPTPPFRSSVRAVASFDHRVDVELGGLPFAFRRGYAWTDLEAGDARFRFVTTQLESQSAEVALAQAQDLLLAAADNRALTTVIVGDFNSDPAGDRIRAGSAVPDSAAYNRLHSGGFVDQFDDLRPPVSLDPTFGLGELVNDATPAGFDPPSRPGARPGGPGHHRATGTR